MLDPVTLREYESCPVELDAQDADFITAELSKKISISREPQGPCYVLNPGPHVGLVALPSDRLLRVDTKVDVRNVFHMLGVACGLWDSFRDEIVPLERIEEVFEFILQHFAQSVEELIDQGLYRAYVEMEDSLSTVKGRIDFAQDVRQNYVLRHRTYCRYTEFTWDIPENQVIRQVAHMLSSWALWTETRNRLGRIDVALADVSPTQLPAMAVGHFSYHRLNEKYRPLHALCRIFLEGASLSEELGTFSSRAFLIDMNKLFETFVTEVLRERLRAPYVVSAQVQSHLDEDRLVPMRPDLVVSRNGLPRLVADCKYKMLSPDEFKNHDVYQMLAYCTSEGLGNGLLIYPRHEVPITAQVAVRNTDIVIRQTTLDLATVGADLVAECDRLARYVLTCAKEGTSVAVGQVA